MLHMYCVYVFSDTPCTWNTVTLGAFLPVFVDPVYKSYSYPSCYKDVCRYENNMRIYEDNLCKGSHVYAITEDGVVVTIMLDDTILDSVYEDSDEFVEVY